MRTEFAWYFKPTEAEIREIWDRGVLTVDANVLLDLYRYNEKTRNSLLACLRRFQSRLWLSRQAAEEFFRNRSGAIVAASGGFTEATEELAKMRKALSPTIRLLAANRLIAAEVSEELGATLDKAIEHAQARIEHAKGEYPRYLEGDLLLEELLTLFDQAVGPAFSEEDLKRLRGEAEHRRKAGIPPGYKDDGKDGDKPYGDFFLWRQVLDYAKSKPTPVIFVTSERKEDWWERHSGQTIGPRTELIREAKEYANEPVLIYRTDHFLEVATRYAGGTVDAEVVREIRAVDESRASAGVVRSVQQAVQSCDTTSNAGLLTVTTSRAVPFFTASGHFDPRLATPPAVNVGVLETPDGTPICRVGAKTGTVHDFNIHVRSIDPNAKLPAGVYVFEYLARSTNVGTDV